MLNVRGKYKDFKITADGNFELIFEIPKTARAAMLKGIDDIREKDIDIKADKHKEKRSLDANSYFWALCGQLAEIQGLSNTEVYQVYIKEYAPYRTVEINNAAKDTLIKVWTDRGLGWLAETVDSTEDYTLLNLYYGSSVFSKKQFSRLLDGLIQDCKAVGIETLTPAELKGLIDRWNTKEAEK